MNAKQLSEVIEEARKSKEMTQEEQLAKMLGIGILTASFYKNGVFKAIPFIEHTKMSSGLNIPNEEAACISFPDIKGFYYCVPSELYNAHASEIKTVCKDKGAGLIVDGFSITTILKPKVRKEVKPLTDSRYLHYIRLFAKKWVRKRELIDECNIK